MDVVMAKKNYLLLIVFLLTACSNPYYDFYRGNRYERNSSCEYYGSIASATEISKYLNDGYVVIGESAFSSTENNYSVEKMISACKSVGGDAAIIVEPEYQRSENVVRTYYTYQPGQTYTVNTTNQISGGYSGDIYGQYNRVGSYNGNFNGMENSQTTIRSDGHLEAHPYMTTADRHVYRAFYLKKMLVEKKKVKKEQWSFEKRKNEPVIIVGQTEIFADKIESLARLLEEQQSSNSSNRMTESQLRYAVVDNLVGQELVKLECEKQGIVISASRVDEMMEKFRSVYKSEYEFQMALEKSNNTIAQLRQRIEDQLKSEALLEMEVPRYPEQDRPIRVKKYLNELGKKYEVRYLDELYTPPDAIGL